MATAGFAIGLGNIWRFPYVAGMNGGGAFLLIYIVLCLVICAPLFIGEMALGRKTRLNPISGMRRLTRKGSPWVLFGWFGTLAALLIISYYLMITGWIFGYLSKAIGGAFTNSSVEEVNHTFQVFTANPLEVVFYTLIPIVILGFIVIKGVKKGVERATKIMMPLLFLCLIGLALYSMFLPGAIEGVKWYLMPDFTQVNSRMVLSALGQAFFSVGIGLAAAFTYGSYVDPVKSDLPSDGIIIIVLNILIAILAGLVIFPALFSLGIPADSGPSLVFLTMPSLFSQLPGGYYFGVLFFILLFIAAMTTAIGFVESISDTMATLLKISRIKSVWLTLGLMFVLAVPSILSQGPWSHVSIMGKDIFEFVDFLSGNILLPVGGLILALFITFKWGFGKYMEEINIGANLLKVGPSWKPVISYVVPLIVCYILISGLL